MKLKRPTIAACAIAAAMTAGAQPAVAQSDSAISIRKLDIMLMVTSLRCRHGEHDFRADYRRFTATHLKSLNAAHKRLRSELVARHGAKGSKRAMDRMGVSMANLYGLGHPWLDCAELKATAQDLSAMRDESALYEAAKRLLAAEPTPPAQIAGVDSGLHASPGSEPGPYGQPGRRPLVASHDQ
ncbi:MAG: S-adenosyl-L-homocysteine hydrolase [Erythrobacter sp.]|nr:S-adenosyl-L-homocysteine hydrolase [Erythrobacter sp.]